MDSGFRRNDQEVQVHVIPANPGSGSGTGAGIQTTRRSTVLPDLLRSYPRRSRSENFPLLRAIRYVTLPDHLLFRSPFQKGSRRGLLLFINNPIARFHRGTHGSDGAAVLGRRQFDGALHVLRGEPLSFKHEFDEDLGVALRMIISPLPADVYLKSRHIGTLLSHDRDDVHSGATRYPHENHFHGRGACFAVGIVKNDAGAVAGLADKLHFFFPLESGLDGHVPFPFSTLGLSAGFEDGTSRPLFFTPCRIKTQARAPLQPEGFPRSNLIALGLYTL